jgi:hypothetical protein
MTWRLPLAPCIGSILAAAASSLAAQSASLPPSVEIRIPKPPTVAHVNHRAVLAYELHVTNFTRDTLTLSRVDVLADTVGAGVIATLADSALIAAIARPGVAVQPAQRAKVAGGVRAVLFMWVDTVERARLPSVIRHRLTFAPRPADSGRVTALETRPVPISHDVVVLGPPLRGGPWFAANGPDPVSGHRRAMIALDGAPYIAQRFAIDYVQVNEQSRRFNGDSLDNKSYFAYRRDALAVADGIVVAVKDSIPENVPGSRAVPITLETVGGNFVILDLGRGRYAFYAHLIPGSLRVRVGDRVRRGQVVGLVGNSGNSTEPHLHFHLSDGTTPLASEGLPYVHESLVVAGECRSFVAPCDFATATTRRRQMPAGIHAVRFPD